MKYYILTIGKSKLYYIKVLDISQEILNFENLVKLLNHFMILNEVKEITLAESNALSARYLESVFPKEIKKQKYEK